MTIEGNKKVVDFFDVSLKLRTDFTYHSDIKLNGTTNFNHKDIHKLCVKRNYQKVQKYTFQTTLQEKKNLLKAAANPYSNGLKNK